MKRCLINQGVCGWIKAFVVHYWEGSGECEKFLWRCALETHKRELSKKGLITSIKKLCNVWSIWAMPWSEPHSLILFIFLLCFCLWSSSKTVDWCEQATEKYLRGQVASFFEKHTSCERRRQPDLISIRTERCNFIDGKRSHVRPRFCILTTKNVWM